MDGGGSWQPDGGAALLEAKPFANPPTYLGSVNGGATCSQKYATIGHMPKGDSSARYPLFLYFVGTSVTADDEGSRYDCKAALAVTEAMARRGFVALSAQYDNSLTFAFDNKLKCAYNNGDADLLSIACALPEVDCDKGIATWGHSQGALAAHIAANFDPRVRAVWTTGYGGFDAAALPKNRLRVVNGAADGMNADVATLNKTVGFSAAQCPNDGRTECLRADGSGWVLVQKADCQLTAADHCWFDKINCLGNTETLEPNWVDPDSRAAFALEVNADWVAATVHRP
ncbi:MAG: hypothetical protein QM778_06950 [Myxococcales bacterium]